MIEPGQCRVLGNIFPGICGNPEDNTPRERNKDVIGKTKGGKKMRAMRVCCCVCVSMCWGCAKEPASNELQSFPIDSMDGLLTSTGVVFDPEITADQNGSLRIETPQRITVALYETGDLDVEDALLVYRGKLRSRNLEGKAYLEMVCHFAGKGDFFSRALDRAMSGDTGWTAQETPFSLKPGENPDNIKLNVVIDGSGVVWIDDLHLFKEPR